MTAATSLRAVGPYSTRGSRLALPAAALVRLPIGDVKTILLGLAPARTSGVDGVAISAVEQEHDPLIGRGVGRYRRAVQQEAHAGAVRIVVVDREQDRLLAGIGISPGAVRKKAVVSKRP